MTDQGADEVGAFIWVLIEAEKLLMGVSAAGSKAGGHAGSWSPGGTVNRGGGCLLISIAGGC